MELALFILFVLFSLFATLMERRKRKALEEQQQQGQGGPPRPASTVEVEEEAPWSVDPFELPKPRDKKSAAAAETREMTSMQAQLERLAEQAGTREEEAAEQVQEQESVERIQEMEQRARQLERQAQENQPRQRVAKLLRQSQAQRAATSVRRTKRGWKLDPEAARRAIVYAEILGRPKAERDEEF